LSQLAVEFVGTFFLVMTVNLNITDDTQGAVLNPLAIGSILVVMIFMVGHISGAHYNPAVTLAVLLSGRQKISIPLSIGYWIVQIIGGLLGAITAYGLSGQAGSPSPAPYTPGQAFGAEILFTFALCSVVLNVATTKSQEGNSFFGLAIGFTLLSGAGSVGYISGAVFNPAVGTGLTLTRAIFKHGSAKYLWIYWVAPLSGGLAASLFFRLVNRKEYVREYTTIQDTTPRY